MNIMFVSSEAVPYVQTGGLGDVVGTLAQEVSKRNHHVSLVLPFYKSIRQKLKNTNFIELADPLRVEMGDRTLICKVWNEKRSPFFNVYCIEYNQYFDRENLYGENGTAYPDNCERFAFFSKSALDLAVYLKLEPRVIHLNDWQTALIAYYLKTWFWHEPMLKQATSVLTIHNMGYQGHFDAANNGFIGLNWLQMRSDEFEDRGGINLLKGGIYYADSVTTVSPTYAKEIMTEPGACGLSQFIKRRGGDVEGILNGIDENEWNSQSDTYLPQPYSADDLTGKAVCKEALQKRFGLKPNPQIPVFGMVGRMAYQKGLQLFMDCANEVLSWELQIIVLGSGEPVYTTFFSELAKKYSHNTGVYIGFQNELAHLIEAGSDFFIMPSLYEPCGLNQIYSMLYGTLPIVRATGGLNDTVRNYNEADGSGTGFIFYDISGDALKNTIGWALSTWYNRKRDYDSLQQQAMRQNFGWGSAVRRYEAVYRKAIRRRKQWL